MNEEQLGVGEVEETTLPEVPTGEENLEVESQPIESEGEGSDEPTSNEDVESDKAESGKRPNRLERRFQKMSQKMRGYAQENAQLRQYAPPASQVPYQYNQPEYQQEPTADVLQTASAIAQLEVEKFKGELSKEKRVDNFDTDVLFLEQRFPELNEESPQYDPKLSEKVANMYLKYSEKDPDVRLRDIAQDVMDVAARRATVASAKVTKKIAQQASEAAVLPNASDKPASKDFTEKSLEEMEKELGFAS